MITEAVMELLLWVFGLLDELVPNVPWPEWMSAPLDWAESMSDGVDISGVTAWIHPITVDVIALALILRFTKIFIERIRSLFSLITGGGGNR